MEIRKEMPEEVKNQIVDGKKRVITEKIPEKFAKKITEKLQLKGKRIQQFFQLSLTVAKAQQKQQETLQLFKSVEDSIADTLKRAFKKLGLTKKQKEGYNFRFDGKDSFIGVYNPPRPKNKEENK